MEDRRSQDDDLVKGINFGGGVVLCLIALVSVVLINIGLSRPARGTMEAVSATVAPSISPDAQVHGHAELSTPIAVSSTSGMFGPVGGVLASEDGATTLTIPPGALTEQAKVVLEVLPGPRSKGFALSYRMEPNHVRLVKPVDFKFVYANLDVIDLDIAQMGAAWHSAAEGWTWLGKPTIDRSESTLAVATRHSAGALCLTDVDQFLSRPKACW